MRSASISRLRDALAKLQAQHELVKGGTQYSPDVSLGVAGINRGHSMMRNKKLEGVRPLPLRELQIRNKK